MRVATQLQLGNQKDLPPELLGDIIKYLSPGLTVEESVRLQIPLSVSLNVRTKNEAAKVDIGFGKQSSTEIKLNEKSVFTTTVKQRVHSTGLFSNTKVAILANALAVCPIL